MRYLGVDYGTKRIGLALSDPDGTIATPLSVVAGLDAVAEAARRFEVQTVVVGLSFDARRRPTATSAKARVFAQKLKRALQLPVVFENELLTTRLAERAGRAGRADASAAALILQSYLDRLNAKSK